MKITNQICRRNKRPYCKRKLEKMEQQVFNKKTKNFYQKVTQNSTKKSDLNIVEINMS